MKKKMINSDMPIGKMVRIKDFLPSPEKLAIPEETIKITLSLKKASIDFFKQQAERYHTKYQRMIRELIDRYTTQYSK
jgi:predicted DNA binding CopG/RHH family protein